MLAHVADPGLQAERTSLSWTRTGLAFFVCAATLLRWSPAYPGLIAVASGLLAVGGVVIFALNRRGYRAEADALAHEHSAPSTGAVCLTTATLIALAALALWLVVVSEHP